MVQALASQDPDREATDEDATPEEMPAVQVRVVERPPEALLKSCGQTVDEQWWFQWPPLWTNRPRLWTSGFFETTNESTFARTPSSSTRHASDGIDAEAR